MPVSTQPSQARRRPYDAESVLAVAVEVFNERGYDGTSMEDLSRAAGITKSSIYHHVSGKSELLRRALDRALDALFVVLDEPVDEPALARLERVIRRSVLTLDAELPYVTLLLRVRGNSAVETEALARRRDFDHRVAELVAAAAEDGDLRPDVDPAMATRLIFGLVNSVSEWYRPDRGASAEQIADAVVELVLHGLQRS